MLVGILSDTHDQLTRTTRAVSKLASEGAQVLIHCGDLTSPAIVYALAGLPAYVVFGNNDYDRHAIRIAIDEIEGTCLDYGGIVRLEERSIAVTHGDRPGIFRDLLVALPDYLLFGHTHVPHNERDGATRQINPGALHRAAEHTVALLDLSEDRVEFLKFV